MLVQLHWQNRNDRSETMMVAQTDTVEQGELDAWLSDLIESRKDECPEGWEPLVCNENSEYFWWSFGDKVGPAPAKATKLP